jgi:precorrin isomerase
MVCEAHKTFGEVIVAVGNPPTVTLRVAGLMHVPSTLIAYVPAVVGVNRPVAELMHVGHGLHDHVSVVATLGDMVNAIG